jgi:hypothetical protein
MDEKLFGTLHSNPHKTENLGPTFKNFKNFKNCIPSVIFEIFEISQIATKMTKISKISPPLIFLKFLKFLKLLEFEGFSDMRGLPNGPKTEYPVKAGLDQVPKVLACDSATAS